MPDYGFIAQPQNQNTFQKIGEIINFARSGTALQREQATLQADIERAKAESSSAGTAASLAAQTLAPRVEQQAAQTATAKTQAASAQWKLDSEQAGKLYELASGIAQDPAVVNGDSAGSVAALMRAEEIARAHKIPEDKIRVQFGPMYGMAAHNPAGLRQAMDNIIRGGSGVQSQASVINAPVTPVQAQSGAIVPLQLQPGARGAVQPVPISSAQPNASGGAQPGVIPPGIPPAQLQKPGTDALGRPVIEQRDQGGAISYLPPPGSNYKPLMTLPPGETPDTAKPLLALREQAQAAAASVPSQRFNNRQIIGLADTAFTGTGSPELARVLNAVGIKNISGEASKDTAQLQHFIALQIEKNAAAQGANTDAARALAAQAVLPGNTPGQTIKAITKINDAYATGTELFNRGIQATLNNPNNPKDVFAIRDFQNGWTANMDPRIFQLENAVKDGDKKEVENIKKQLGPEGIKQLTVKARNLQRLIQQGAVGGP